MKIVYFHQITDAVAAAAIAENSTLEIYIFFIKLFN